MAYIVKNRMAVPIWLKDGLWDSGEIDVNGERTIKSDHNANVTLYTGKSDGNKELGQAWIPETGSIEVHGKWNWNVRPS